MFTLRVVSMENGECDRAMHFVLAGDDDGVEQALVSCRVESVRQRDGGTQLLDLHHQTKFTYACGHNRCIVPVTHTHVHTHTHTTHLVIL